MGSARRSISSGGDDSLFAVVPATIGIVGLGYWGPNLLRNFAASPGWTVKYGCDLSAAHRDKMRAQYPSVTYTDRLADVLDDPDQVQIDQRVFGLAHQDCERFVCPERKSARCMRARAVKVPSSATGSH